MSDQTTLVSPNLKHTPGPWRLETKRGLIEIVATVRREEVVVTEVPDEIDGMDALADARLIAKSPVLLDAIERAMAVLHPNQRVVTNQMARSDAFDILCAALEDLTA